MQNHTTYMERMTLPHQNDSTCVTVLGTAAQGARKVRPSLTHVGKFLGAL